jgi:erythronate-4-phosphate dehydrogenase
VLILFQEGIPDIFLATLTAFGHKVQRFSTVAPIAHKIFEDFHRAEVIFFRANFTLGETELGKLPSLRLACLVSTGTDNIDSAAVETRGITLTTGEGANAQAVFDYVMQALALANFDASGHSVGVVGAGRIGGRLVRFLRSVSTEVHFYDPFSADPGSLASVLACDFISFHTPLTHSGAHATHHMLDDSYFSSLNTKAQIIQTCRGGIWKPSFFSGIDGNAVVQILAQDVYPIEPPPVHDLARAKFSTPHIAGYSMRGRLGGILNGLKAINPEMALAVELPEAQAWFLADDAALFAESPQDFNRLRDGYGWRKEFHEYNARERQAFTARYPRLQKSMLEQLFEFTG